MLCPAQSIAPGAVRAASWSWSDVPSGQGPHLESVSIFAEWILILSEAANFRQSMLYTAPLPINEICEIAAGSVISQ